MLVYQTMREGKLDSSRRIKCPECGAESAGLEWERALQVCPRCGFHAPIDAYYRLSGILDPGSFQELEEVPPADPLAFPDYPAKLARLEVETGLRDGAVTALGRIEGRRAVFGVMDSRFLMGSMGTAVGERITQAAEYAARKKLPLVIFSASGGARMQEGIFSLMQMAKTAAAVQRFQSFASLGDIMLAEPGALIGFAGPRVIEQTIKEQLPEGFQRAEYLLDHGFLDQIVPRSEWRTVLAQLLALHEKGGRS